MLFLSELLRRCLIKQGERPHIYAQILFITHWVSIQYDNVKQVPVRCMVTERQVRISAGHLQEKRNHEYDSWH